MVAVDLERMIAADHPERALTKAATMAPLFLNLEPLADADLPIAVRTATGELVARFKCDGDASIFLAPFQAKDRRTLPAPFVRRLAGQ